MNRPYEVEGHEREVMQKKKNTYNSFPAPKKKQKVCEREGVCALRVRTKGLTGPTTNKWRWWSDNGAVDEWWKRRLMPEKVARDLAANFDVFDNWEVKVRTVWRKVGA